MKKAITGGGRGCNGSEGRCAVNVIVLMGVIFLVSELGLTAFVLSGRPSDGLWPVNNVDVEGQAAESNSSSIAAEDEAAKHDDDDLLPTGFDEKSCMSRRESVLYRGRGRKASPSLISKLRRYEARHKRCGPHTESYNSTVQLVKSDCRYVVWMSFTGLGNRILSLVSAFLYALLTDRVLLLYNTGPEMLDLFCEPFPQASWLLPSDFPYFTPSFNIQTYGTLLRTNSTASPPYMHVDISTDNDNYDKRFFCDQDQPRLHNTPWLIIRSFLYFVPSLFSMPSFQHELDALFPDKEAVFHLLARYLLHPTNTVWGLITRYHQAYLSKADETVGIQIRVFDDSAPFKNVLDQILSCTTREKILPEISQQERQQTKKKKKKRVSVLITSLSSGYSEQVRDLYWENPTAMGEVVSVFQPTQEGQQQSKKQSHNQKAWAEVYLLSLMDKLVTSEWSTFGYVAQGLGGVKPWMMYMPHNQTAPLDPPCRRAVSVEPCFHFPPYLDCTTGGAGGDALGPHLMHCEEWEMGIKLFNNKTLF